MWQSLIAMLDSLLDGTRNYDYAIFFGWPDDTVMINGKTYYQTRDNVVFEVGLFLSVIGKSRTFYVVPKMRSEQPFRVLTDIGDSLNIYRYDCNVQGSSIEPVEKSLSTTVTTMVGHIKRHAASSQARDRSRAQAALDYEIASYKNELAILKDQNASEAVVLRSAKCHIENLLLHKSVVTQRAIDDVTWDLALYFEMIDDIVNVWQLAEKQRWTATNHLEEVWVFADDPLEFCAGRTEGIERQMEKLRETVALNVNNDVKYTYYVSQGFNVEKIGALLDKYGIQPEHIQKVNIVKLPSKRFKTFFTVHWFRGMEADVYMSALMEDRDDLLIKISSAHKRRILKILRGLAGKIKKEHGVEILDLSNV
jgi:hypothetical protein